jgi:hypothetical protein
VLEEKLLNTELGFIIRNRLPKSDLIAIFQMARRNDKETIRPDAMVLLSMYARVQDGQFRKSIKLRIETTTYGPYNRFLGSFKLPFQSFAAPLNCLELCLTAIIAKNAEKLAITLSDVLAQKLTYLFPLHTEYILRFKHFSTPEITEIMNTSEQFPGYVTHKLVSKKNIGRYVYRTTAKAIKMDKWLKIVLTDMGLTPGQETIVQINTNEITLEKIITQQQPK